jgi:hypothetical protein
MKYTVKIVYKNREEISLVFPTRYSATRAKNLLKRAMESNLSVCDIRVGEGRNSTITELGGIRLIDVFPSGDESPPGSENNVNTTHQKS